MNSGVALAALAAAQNKTFFFWFFCTRQQISQARLDIMLHICDTQKRDTSLDLANVHLQVSSLRELHQQAQKYNTQLQEYNTKLQQDVALTNDRLQALQVYMQ